MIEIGRELNLLGSVSGSLVERLQEPTQRRFRIPGGKYRLADRTIATERDLQSIPPEEEKYWAEYQAPSGAMILMTPAGLNLFRDPPNLSTRQALSRYEYAQQHPGELQEGRIPLDTDGVRFRVGNYPIEAMEVRDSNEKPEDILARQHFLFLLSQNGILPSWIKIPVHYAVVQTAPSLLAAGQLDLPDFILLRALPEFPTIREYQEKDMHGIENMQRMALRMSLPAALSEARKLVIETAKKHSSGLLNAYFRSPLPAAHITSESVLLDDVSSQPGSDSPYTFHLLHV